MQWFHYLDQSPPDRKSCSPLYPMATARPRGAQVLVPRLNHHSSTPMYLRSHGGHLRGSTNLSEYWSTGEALTSQESRASNGLRRNRPLDPNDPPLGCGL